MHDSSQFSDTEWLINIAPKARRFSIIVVSETDRSEVFSDTIDYKISTYLMHDSSPFYDTEWMKNNSLILRRRPKDF